MKIEDRVVEGVTILDISGKITIGEHCCPVYFSRYS